LKLPFLVDASAGDYAKVKWFANRAYKRAQLQKKSISFKIDNTVTKLKLGDVVEVSNVMFNMDHKKFRVVSIKSSMDEKMLISDIEAIEYITEVFDTSDYQSGGNSGSLPDPSLIINPPNNLVFTQNTGTVQGHGILSWSSQYKGEQRNEVQYRKTGSTTWVTYQTVSAESVTITSLQTGTNYDFRVRTMAAIGYSRWTELLNQRIAKVLTLPAVTGLAGDFTGKDAVIKWDPVKGAIPNLGNPVAGYSDLSELVSYYQVQIAHTTVGNIKSSHIVTDPSFTYSLEQNRKDGLSRNIWVIVTPVSIFADVGASAQVNLYNEPMSQPASVQARSELINLTINWLNPSETVKDYESTDIWVTQSNTIPPTSAEYVISSNVGWWTSVLGGTAPKSGYAWIAHRDFFGHPSSGPVYSVPVYYSETSIDDLLTDSPSFQEVENNLDQVKQEQETQGGKITQLQNRVSLTETSITENKTLIETANTKLAQLDTKVEAQGVVITDQTQAISTVDGTVNALRTIKLDGNGKVSGLQMGNDGSTSTVDFLTDVFRISSSAGTASVFEVRGGKTMIKSLLVGDITASQIAADQINGNHIAANSIIQAGSGATSATLNGSDATWRIYSGSITPASAPFRVSGAGQLVATNATITGAVNATSGTFSNTLTLNGRLNMTGGYIDGRSGYDTLNFNSGRTRIDSNGTFYCNNAVIRGTLQVQDLVGDITEVFKGTGTSISIGSSTRPRNVIQIIEKFVCFCSVAAGPGELGVRFQALLNGSVIGETTATASTTNGTNSYPLSVYLTDIVGLCPANTTGTLTFRVVTYNANTTSISNIVYSGTHGWLTAVQ